MLTNWLLYLTVGYGYRTWLAAVRKSSAGNALGVPRSVERWVTP
jgi:hypothetical protein